GFLQDVQKLALTGESERIRRIRHNRFGWSISLDDTRENVMKRIFFSEIPNGKCEFVLWSEDSQHFPNALNRRRKKHHAKPAYDCVKALGSERQPVGRRKFKTSIDPLIVE